MLYNKIVIQKVSFSSLTFARIRGKLKARKEMKNMMIFGIFCTLLGINALLGKASFEALNRYVNELIG